MTIHAYHRPSTIDEALALLLRQDVRSVALGGGTAVNVSGVDGEVVDLQDAVPAAIERRGDRVVFGAMARLQDVVEHPATPALLAELARREGPNTLRNAATVGGTVAGRSAESEFLAGLLVFDAVAEINGPAEPKSIPVVQLLADRHALDGSIIRSVAVPMEGATASARAGRTPADTPIVAAVGRVTPDGVRIALTGIREAPHLVDPGEVSDLEPPEDFRGSAAYRRSLAETLVRRVLEQLEPAE